MVVARAYRKSPTAVLDYTFDWTDWLEAGDTLASAVVTITGEDDALVIDAQNDGFPVVEVILSGGTVGVRYRVTCHAVSANGLEDDLSFILHCIQT